MTYNVREVLTFVEYIDSFYNPTSGVYPIEGASVAVITKAIQTYLDALNDDYTWGEGDSVDRERVREIILNLTA